MSRKKYWLSGVIVLVSFAAIVFGCFALSSMFSQNVYDEKEQQLEELTIQVSDMFENAIRFNWACASTAENVFMSGNYATKSDIIQSAHNISTLLNANENECIVMFLDEGGCCYDENGEKGIWGDFDQVAGIEDKYTFIADNVTYSGTHWAFAKKLPNPITVSDGSVTIKYIVLLKTVDSVRGYYSSEAYKDTAQTYILKENGTRMYDSVKDDDIICSYNVYKTLADSEVRYGNTFDKVKEDLNKNGVACGTYKKDGVEYCYSLVWQREYQIVLLFLVPSSDVAVNTVSMVSSMTRTFVVVAAIIILLISFAIFVAMKLLSNKQIYLEKDRNLRETEKNNRKLEEMNVSLIHANKAAESALNIARSANKAKSSFLSNMSHDIRTPLNAIIGFLQLLDRDAEDPEKVRKYSEKINVSSRHLLNLINDILDMSRIESGKTTLNVMIFSIKELVDEIETIIAPQAREKQHNFHVNVSKAARINVLGDRLRLSQILMNLLSNAIKYTPNGGEIYFGVERCGEYTRKMVTLRFIVRDNGIGMSKDFQKRIFEPFEREKTKNIDSVHGTGLGMAITKNLVDLMGGVIILDSEPNKGSVFTLELPMGLPDEKDRILGEVFEAGDDEEEGLKDVLKGMNFLVAEDNEINAEIISELLAMEGASCTIACNGREAVEMFGASKSGTYDAIFMDIQMPVMNGYAAAKEIRRCENRDAMSIPIAAMTANAFAEDVQKALESGMNAHISKPVDMNKIKRFVVNEAKRRKMSD